jgi:hypothetical protein
MSKRVNFARIGSALFAVVLSCTAAAVAAPGDEPQRAAGAGAAQAPQKQQQQPPPRRVPYRPKAGLGKPPGMEGGGSRHGHDPDLFVAVLAPARRDHPALTVRARPALFWFLSKRADCKVRLTIAEEGAQEPLWQALEPAGEAGVRRLDLAGLTNADHRPVALNPGRQYKFSVMLMENPRTPANNPFAACLVERVAAPGGLERRVADARPDDRASVFAEEGLWWDMMAEIADRIAAAPDRRDASLLRQWRAELLQAEDDPAARPDQQILHKVAAAELADSADH